MIVFLIVVLRQGYTQYCYGMDCGDLLECGVMKWAIRNTDSLWLVVICLSLAVVQQGNTYTGARLLACLLSICPISALSFLGITVRREM